jgi:hypothetical protein
MFENVTGNSLDKIMKRGNSMLHRLVWTLGFSMLFLSSLATAQIEVSRTFQTQPLNQAVDVQAGSYWIWPLPGSASGDSYKVEVNSENKLWRDISAFIVDGQNLELFKAGGQFRGVGVTRGNTPFSFAATRPTTEQLYLVIDNRYSLLTTKKARVAVTMTTHLTDEQAEKLENVLNMMYTGVRKLLILPEFNVRVVPCNMVNAYSDRDTGNITLCSEIVSTCANNPPALIWIFLHELGHTALGLWGMPGSDNEDMADEFATDIAIRDKNGSQFVQAAMKFFQNANTSAEVQNMIQRGDRHSLSIQRIRNVTSWLLDPVRLTTKWNNLLYPHMTDDELRTIAVKPGPYENALLAREELDKRSSNTVVAMPSAAGSWQTLV